MLAPILLFTYKRPAHLRRTLASLQKCRLVGDSTLIIFSDAPKHGASDADRRAVTEVRELIREIDWTAQLVIHERPRNFGFNNQIDGITQVLHEHDRVIVLEDDLVVAPAFLEYMNDALRLYESDEDVMHVSGYMLPVDCRLPETLFYNAATCWGWGTWRRAWRHFQDEPAAQLRAVSRHPKARQFDCPPYWYENQLKANAAGQVRTWDGMWHATVFLKNGLCLHPGRSLVANLGHDGSGENCVASTQFETAPPGDERIEVERIDKREWPSIRREIARKYGAPSSGTLQTVRESMIRGVRQVFGAVLGKLVPELALLRKNPQILAALADHLVDSEVDPRARLHSHYRFEQSRLSAYSYVAEDSVVKNTCIGKFTSIGPGFRCGFGLHPLDTVSTSPVFYSVHRQCGETFSRNNKVVEAKPITIGNDVYIGMNVTVLDGVTIGDGAVVGAGAVVASDIPAYAVAVGVPARVVRYRFDPQTVERLLASRWWDGPPETLMRVERNVLDVAAFLAEQEHSARTGAGQA